MFSKTDVRICDRCSNRYGCPNKPKMEAVFEALEQIDTQMATICTDISCSDYQIGENPYEWLGIDLSHGNDFPQEKRTCAPNDRSDWEHDCGTNPGDQGDPKGL